MNTNKVLRDLDISLLSEPLNANGLRQFDHSYEKNWRIIYLHRQLPGYFGKIFTFEADILPNENEKLLATLSGHFMNKTYEFCQHESNSKSTAYIPNGKAKYYFSGVLQGGITKYFLGATDDTRMNIDIDLGNQAMARQISLE
ncbi:MAG: hypothetical protein V3U75_05070 [Methylococcaceae bacterium]